MINNILKSTLGCSVILGAFLAIPVPSTAQERDLTEPEIRQFYEDLYLKETSIINTAETELTDKQREEIAEQIVYHYTDHAVIKLKDVALTEQNDALPPYRAKLDKMSYENVLEVERKIKDMNIQFDIKNIDFSGQRAVVEIDAIYTYRVDATEYDDIVKINADIITKSSCKTHIKIDYDNNPRIDNENCKSNTLISNIEIDMPEHMQDQYGSAEVKFGKDVVFKR